ncbi:MAG TPA: DNA helicase II, partial [Gammaproteobacteria bacterium]|nr:DNA helicase II [Gammaproteobacteria bacterium]
LILAGAGSGKTRVLVHRIAYLVEVENISPYRILAVTFTNKAASEMRQRAEQLLERIGAGWWMGTFHGIAHRILRQHASAANLPEGFQILDSEDQLRTIRRLLKILELDESRWPPRQIQSYINSKKDEGLRPHALGQGSDPFQRKMIDIYHHYEDHCQRAGVIDFAEILLRAHELWLNQPDILAEYQQRFSHILVDEFQDTNRIQYAWLRVLAGHQAKLFVVGDDDQSIYGWRGARIENIQQFPRDYSESLTVRLEQNYRSTGNILRAANAIIQNNVERLGKELWTSAGEGVPLDLYAAFNEVDEARFVVSRIQQKVAEGHQRQEFAVLYRSNAQSRVLEEALLQAGVPYRVYGGMRFFERAEIKDALAYLRLIKNRDDDGALERVINTPTRGIGEKTLNTIRQQARAQQYSLWQAIAAVLETNQLTTRAAGALSAFMHLINQMDEEARSLTLGASVALVLESSTLFDFYKHQRGEKAQSKLENLEELVAAAEQFGTEISEEELPLDPLTEFLSHAALEAGEAQSDDWEDAVQLMTLHSAKGLEFPFVFLCGLEEGLFPHAMSAEDPLRLAEERRLCYVGITRAMQQLTLSHAESRRIYGKEVFSRPSRFIRELPTECIQEIRAQAKMSRPVYRSSQEAIVVDKQQEYSLGQGVFHQKFGEGVILNYEGEGARARIQVQFKSAGSKWLIAEYANLQAI